MARRKALDEKRLAIDTAYDSGRPAVDCRLREEGEGDMRLVGAVSVGGGAGVGGEGMECVECEERWVREGAWVCHLPPAT